MGKPILTDDDISKQRNREDKTIKFYTDQDLEARDFYWKYARGLVQVDSSRVKTKEIRLPAEEFTSEEKAKYSNKHFYELNFSNKGGLVMPIIVEFTFKDGTKTVDRIPAQIWRLNELKTSKFYALDKEVTAIKIKIIVSICFFKSIPNSSLKKPYKKCPAKTKRNDHKSELNTL